MTVSAGSFGTFGSTWLRSSGLVISCIAIIHLRLPIPTEKYCRSTSIITQCMTSTPLKTSARVLSLSFSQYISNIDPSISGPWTRTRTLLLSACFWMIAADVFMNNNSCGLNPISFSNTMCRGIGANAKNSVSGPCIARQMTLIRSRAFTSLTNWNSCNDSDMKIFVKFKKKSRATWNKVEDVSVSKMVSNSCCDSISLSHWNALIAAAPFFLVLSSAISKARP